VGESDAEDEMIQESHSCIDSEEKPSTVIFGGGFILRADDKEGVTGSDRIEQINRSEIDGDPQYTVEWNRGEILLLFYDGDPESRSYPDVEEWERTYEEAGIEGYSHRNIRHLRQSRCILLGDAAEEFESHHGSRMDIYPMACSRPPDGSEKEQEHEKFAYPYTTRIHLPPLETGAVEYSTDEGAEQDDTELREACSDIDFFSASGYTTWEISAGELPVIHTAFFALYILFFFLYTPILLIPFWLMRLLRWDRPRKVYLEFVSRMVSWSLLKVAGATFTVRGLENIPRHTSRLCFIGNHQGYADIPLIRAGIPFVTGFIAKRELAMVLPVGWWLDSFDCILLDRRSPKSAIESIGKGVEAIKNGKPMTIFPEGTRSRGAEMSAFKRGAFKLAVRSRAIIVPLTVNGSYRLFEENGRIQPTHISLTIHPAIDTAVMSSEELVGIHHRVEAVVRSALKPPEGDETESS
jgi:1-acyl-sn-glycerol-3-phosphate acyltransferase